MVRTSLFVLLCLFMQARMQSAAQQTISSGSRSGMQPAGTSVTTPGMLDLSGLAAFRTGDDVTWSSKFIDEREGWNFIPVPGAWERHGFPLHDGIAWYRIRFTLPPELRDDSLLLVMSAVDDADETWLNGVGIGRTGSFPPDVRSELRSLRVYPLPRDLREEHNLLAIRVYDHADSGGITGSIFRIIRATEIGTVLSAIVDAPAPSPPRFITNGIMTSMFDVDKRAIAWCRPRPYSEIAHGLPSEPVLSGLTVTVKHRDRVVPLSGLSQPDVDVEDGTNAIRLRFGEGMDVHVFHPWSSTRRILVVRVAIRPEAMLSSPGLSMTFDRIAWHVTERERAEEGARVTTFILAYHSCCDDLAEREMDDFLKERGNDVPWSLARERTAWTQVHDRMRPFISTLSTAQRMVYARSVVSLLSAQSREEGRSRGQIPAASAPPSRAVTMAGEHLTACEALARAGFTTEARNGLDFIHSADAGAYAVFAPYGEELGVGYSYLVSPAPYLGNGEERQWSDRRLTRLRFDGAAGYIRAVHALLAVERDDAQRNTRAFLDSSLLAPFWSALSRRVADVLLYRRDSSGLTPRDASPWGPPLTTVPSVYTTMHDAASLELAAGFAATMHDDYRRFLYGDAAARARNKVRALMHAVASGRTADQLTPEERAVFHPLITDGVFLGTFHDDSVSRATAFDIVRNAYAMDDDSLLFNAEPDGDWFARQARPMITLRLSRAYAAAGDTSTAARLLDRVTRLALRGGGHIPELVDPVSHTWHGGLPALGGGAAEYIIACHDLMTARASGTTRKTDVRTEPPAR